MALNFNGNTPKKVNVNIKNSGIKHVARVIFNNVVVWLEKVLTTITGYPITLTNSTGDDLVDYKVYGNSIQGRLPDEYQEVEYIESTGTQYIDTGFKPNQNTKVETYIYSNENNKNFNNPFGSRNNNAQQFFIGVETSSNYNWFFRYGTKYHINTFGNKVGYNNVVINKNVYSINNDEYIFTTQTFQSNNNMYIFACNNNGQINDRGFNGKIYCFKIWDNEKLIRDFIPCYRKSDNVIGMYDLVNNVFYTNEGTGTFTKGDNVTPTPDTPVEIQSVGDKTKNLLNMGKYTQNKNYGIDDTTGEIKYIPGRTVVIDYIEVKSNTNYVFSGKALNTTYKQLYIYAYDDLKNFIGKIGGGYVDKIKFTTSENCKYIRFYYEKIENLQLEEGDTATEYEPYGYKIPIKVNENITNIYLDEPLRKIGNYADYIDFVNKKVVRNVKVVDDTGTLPIEESYQGLAIPTEETIELPTISTNKGTNIIEVDTNIKPSKMEVQYYAKEV